MYMRDKEEMKKTSQRVTSGPVTTDRISINITFRIQKLTAYPSQKLKINAERQALKPITRPVTTHGIRQSIANSCAGCRGGALKGGVMSYPLFSLGLFSLLY